MRILHLSKYFRPDPGGLERVVGQLVDGAAQRGHDVRVVCATGSSWVRDPRMRITEPPRGGVAVVRLPTYGTWWGQPVVPGYPAAARWPADVIHLHQPHPLADWSAWRAPRKPLVVTHHSDVRRQWLARPFYWPLVRGTLRRAQAIVVPTAAHLPACPELRGFEDKTHVIPFGVDLTHFTPRAHPEPPPRFPAPGGPVGLFVGRLVGYKGLDVLADALAGTDLRLAVVGGGPERPAFEARLAERGAADRVTFGGEVEDKFLPSWYQAADYLVLPSTTPAEMFGVVLIEAMAMGKPVITTALPTGVREVNEAGVTGLEVPPGDAGALREAMRTLAGDADRRRRMGEAARRRVLAQFTLERMVEAHLALYQRIQ